MLNLPEIKKKKPFTLKMVIKMNEMEYVEARIKDLEKEVKRKDLPLNLREIHNKALSNYRSDLERLKNSSF